MAKIAILDIDSKIPNLALMKISTYHKTLGDDIDFYKYNIKAYPSKNKIGIIFDGKKYDKIYASILFTTNKDILKIINNDNYEIGGTGYNLNIKLPQHIDILPEDYSLYPNNKISYGFITRGCIRKCYFCFVPKKEGKLYLYNDINNIIRHDRVSFMDNNILAYKNHKNIFKEIINKNIKLTFNQGLDIRLIDEENAKLLSKMNYMKEYIFAFDDISNKNIIENKLKIVKKYINKDWKIKFFIYCHPEYTTIKSIKQRIEWCYKNKCLPYIMRDFDCYNSINSNFYTDIASWCNQPGLFKNMRFDEFCNKKSKNKKRIARSKAIYYRDLH